MEDGKETYLYYDSHGAWLLTTGANYRSDTNHCWFYIHSEGFNRSFLKLFITQFLQEYDVRELPSSNWNESTGTNKGSKQGATVSIN